MTFLDHLDEKQIQQSIQLNGIFPNPKQPVFTEHIFSLWHLKIAEFVWEISFRLMKSGVRREMVITL